LIYLVKPTEEVKLYLSSWPRRSDYTWRWVNRGTQPGRDWGVQEGGRRVSLWTRLHGPV